MGYEFRGEVFQSTADGWNNVADVTQVEISGDGRVWILNENGTIEILDSEGNVQNTFVGNFSDIAVNDAGEAWALDDTENIYQWNADTETWDQVPGQLAEISIADDGRVWGVNSSGRIYTRAEGGSRWSGVPGRLAEITVESDGTVWGVNAIGSLYHRDGYRSSWVYHGSGYSDVEINSDGTLLAERADGQVVEITGTEPFAVQDAGDSSTIQGWGIRLDVDENAAGAVVGILSTVDADDGDSHTYTVSDDRFEVVDNELKLKDGVSLNYEEAASVDVIITTTDSAGASYDESFTINVNNINEASLGSDDTGSTSEDTTLNVNAASGLLANDSDIDGDTLSVASFTTAGDGTTYTAGDMATIAGVGSLTINADGSYTFIPVANYNGAVPVATYVLDDGNGATDTATLTISIAAVNDAPLADDEAFTIDEDVTSGVIDLLAGDSDVDGDTLSVASINGTAITPGTAQTIAVSNGTVNVSAGGVVTFTPAANYNGAISFDYIVSDGNGATDTGTVNGMVNAVNDAPGGADQTISTLEDTPVSGVVEVNDVDDRLIDLVFTEGASPTNGTLVINGDGSYSYTPNPDYNGADTFTIVVTDPTGAWTEISVDVDIEAVNDLPVTISEPTIAVEDGEIIEIDASGLFRDVEGDVLTYEAINLPSWLTLDPSDGQLRGTVPADASQSPRIEFSILARDGDGVPTTAVVIIVADNIDPVAVGVLADQTGVELDNIYLETSGGFADGGTDTDSLVFSVAGLPDGLVIDAATGVISGVLNGNTVQAGGYLVTVTANDGQGGAVQQEFIFHVTPYQDIGERYRENETGPATGTAVDPADNQDTGRELAPENLIITSTAEAQGNLRVIQSLDGVGGIILDTIHNINSLKDVVNSDGVSSPVSEQVATIERLLENDGASGHDGEDWNVEGLTGFSIKFDVSLDDAEGASHRESSQLLIETYVRQRVLYIDVNNSLDPVTEGKVIKYGVLLANGDPLPSWIRIAREGFIVIERPADVRNLDLTISAELDNGRIISRSFTVDASTGEVQSLQSAKNTDGATTFSNQVRSIIRDDTNSSDKLQRALGARHSK